MKLILIFGVWMNLSQVAYLNPLKNGCVVVLKEKVVGIVLKNHICDEVAHEINKVIQKENLK